MNVYQLRPMPLCAAAAEAAQGGGSNGKTAADMLVGDDEEQQAAEERVRAQLGRAIAEPRAASGARGGWKQHEGGGRGNGSGRCVPLHRRHVLCFELSNVAVNALWQLRDWGRFHAYADRLDDCMGAHYPRLHPRKALILAASGYAPVRGGGQMSQVAQTQQLSSSSRAAKLPRRAAMASRRSRGAGGGVGGVEGLRCYGRALVPLKLALGPSTRRRRPSRSWRSGRRRRRGSGGSSCCGRAVSWSMAPGSGGRAERGCERAPTVYLR